MARPRADVSFSTLNGRVRARKSVTLPDGTKKRFTGYGSTKYEAEVALQENIKAAEKEARYGAPEEDEGTTLAEAVRIVIDQRKNECDRVKRREARREATSKRDEDVMKALILPHRISKKKMNEILPKDIVAYRRWLSEAKHKNWSKEEYYSPTSLNRAIRLVKAALDDWYKFSDIKSPAGLLEPFTQSTVRKNENDFLIGEEVPAFIAF